MIGNLRPLFELLWPAGGDVGLLLERRVLAAKWVLVLERIWRGLLWPFVATGGFVFVSLLGIWNVVPAWVHSFGLLAYAVALIGALASLAHIGWPGRGEALRRLERDSGARHRPASSYDDKLANNVSATSEALWRLHRQRLARLIQALKFSVPNPRLDRFDPFAVRALVLLLLVTAAIAAGSSAWDRVISAFTLTSGGAEQRYRLHAWVTPPLYTGKPPIVLADGKPLQQEGGGGKPRAVPEGSVLLVRINGGPALRPALNFDEAGSGTRRTLDPSSSDERLAEYEMTLHKSGRLDVIGGARARVSWSFNVVADAAPTIRLLEKPNATPRRALRLAYHVEDDYGVSYAEARFELAGGADAVAPGRGAASSAALTLIKQPVVPLRLPNANTRSGEARTFKDLTSHPWAGLAVAMTLVVRDQGGKEGRSETVELTLPARIFTKPLARAVVEQRRKLVMSRTARLDVAEALDGLTVAPERFIPDKVVYLGLRLAYWRLLNREDAPGLLSVTDQIWDVALRIEDGDLMDAERALQTAQDRLMKAIRDGASGGEIKRLVEELRVALGRFLQALTQHARQNGRSGAPDGDLGDRLLSTKDFDQLLRQIETLAKTGSRDLAQLLLDELRGILERIQLSMAGQNVQRDLMMKAMKGLSGIITQQQRLLDETFDLKRRRQSREGRAGRRSGETGGRHGHQGQGPDERPAQSHPGQLDRGGRAAGALAHRQGALGERLQGLMRQLQTLGATPPNQLGGASRSMGDAHRALRGQALGRATQQQSLALDRLRQGTQAMAEQMMRMLGAQISQHGHGSRDPLGRPERTRGPDLGTSVRVPDEIDIQRAREILDELRRRLSEPRRPLLELDYLERLIRNF